MAIRELYAAHHWDQAYFDSIVELIKELETPPTHGLDVGFAWGMSAQAFLENTDAPLVCLDLDDQMDKAEAFKEKWGKRFAIYYGDSSTNMKLLKGTFDWIYIDAAHDYDGVKKDIEAAWPLLAPGGVMVFDDYGNPCGVKQAVDELAAKRHLRIDPIPKHPSRGVYVRRNA